CWRDFSRESRSNWLLCGAFILGSFLSIVMAHTNEVPLYDHYFAQLVPGLSMFAAAIFLPHSKDLSSTRIQAMKFWFGIVVIVVLISRTSAAEWAALTQRLWGGKPLSIGIEYDIADLIRSQGTEDYSLFLLDNHLVYWLLGRYPPTRLATHPSNIGKSVIR